MTRLADRPLPTLRQTLARVHRRLVLVAVLLSGAMLMISGTVTIRAYFERNIALVARTIAYTVEPAIIFGDPDAIRSGVASVALVNDIRLVEVRDEKGKLLTRWANPKIASNGILGNLAEAMLDVTPVAVPVRHGDTVIGEVRVIADTSMLTGYLFSGTIISVCCLGLTIIAVRILARRMENGVRAPLHDIAAVAHAVRSDRALDRRVRPSGIAELDQFGRDFNALLSELQGWHESLANENDKLAHEAMHDALTSLGNRALFERTFVEMVAQTARSGRSFALLYLDADRFKQINDRYGHQAGDTLLMEIAKRLRACIREQDHAFRLGGDEFALMLGPSVDRALLEAVMLRIERTMELPVELPSGEQIVCSLSTGGAICPDDGELPEDVFRSADEDMYQHKLHKRRHAAGQG